MGSDQEYRSVKKGEAGEKFWQRFIPQGSKQKFTIVDPGVPNRVEDIFITEGLVANEVKNYADNVPLSSFIKSQVDRDVYLRSTGSIDRSVWAFVNKGPSAGLESYLRENMIEFIHLTN